MRKNSACCLKIRQFFSQSKCTDRLGSPPPVRFSSLFKDPPPPLHDKRTLTLFFHIFEMTFQLSKTTNFLYYEMNVAFQGCKIKQMFLSRSEITLQPWWGKPWFISCLKIIFLFVLTWTVVFKCFSEFFLQNLALNLL